MLSEYVFVLRGKESNAGVCRAVSLCHSHFLLAPYIALFGLSSSAIDDVFLDCCDGKQLQGSCEANDQCARATLTVGTRSRAIVCFRDCNDRPCSHTHTQSGSPCLFSLFLHLILRVTAVRRTTDGDTWPVATPLGTSVWMATAHTPRLPITWHSWPAKKMHRPWTRELLVSPLRWWWWWFCRRYWWPPCGF